MLKRLPRLTITRLYNTTFAPRFSGTMSSNDQQTQTGSSEAKDTNKTPLPLPAPEHAAADQGDDVTSLRMGESVKLDAMGPLVVNTDGTMGRIGNWAGMTEHERAQTLRLLGKRNKERMDVLKAKKAEEEQKSDANAEK
ncbi:hypothetical protein H9Q69_002220 [Fusarium xylarioides]|uniref:Uncharacterized protein n=1 Tax=Fusarium xylarioides TaxID=221167 RepID=A0A9P7HS31_9HYPO|nr:hypothetical protein H9Q70_005953 [Fusarium xylarioides]KAG5761157.1 hypothetical protein H9Q72_010730 [Fusarium xylarioides]KAG5785557.1 hypothetical protein H9Q73_000824 [Fusarium xylarioides]KAG5798732.1 hypothetical protein H9Q69_002220 [Fusarium xylarioides]KAG5810865.1 hypothetical protein H9Q71_005201 [Fusarium xylarioides]